MLKNNILEKQLYDIYGEPHEALGLVVPLLWLAMRPVTEQLDCLG